MSVAVEVPAAIRTLFYDRVAAGLGLVIVHDNQNRPDVPVDGSWCRLVIQQGITDPAMIGGSTALYRTSGVVNVQLFTPSGAGADGARAIFAVIQDQFRRLAIGDPVIRFGTPYLSGESLDGGSWQTNIIIPFKADEHG